MYSAYGLPFASTGTEPNAFRYGGKVGYYTEGVNGLILATYRWYSPYLMRWISRDPIGYDGGANLYEYVGGRPVKYLDSAGWFLDSGNNSIGSDKGFDICKVRPELCSYGSLLCGDPNELRQCIAACIEGGEAALDMCRALGNPLLQALCYAAVAGGTATCTNFCYARFVD